MKFYAYLWLRADGTPYYVGKGTGRRAFARHKHHYPPKESRILLFYRSSEGEAFETERELIANWGRKDLGLGCLINRTDGGEGPVGVIQSPEKRARIAETLMGHPVLETTREKIRGNKNSLGYHHTEEVKARGRARRLGVKATAETREKQRQKKIGNQNALGHHLSMETRQRLSLSAKMQWAAKRT